MSKVSSEYANALFMLAVENDAGASYEEALELVRQVFTENPMYPKLLSSFSIPLEERLLALDKAFSASIPKEVLSFLKLLCEGRHIDEFPDCVAQYKAMMRSVNKVSKAKVTSAVQLDEAEKAALLEKLEKLSGNKVITEYAVDSSILGGLVVEMDGRIMDSSLKKHLNKIKDVIKNEHTN